MEAQAQSLEEQAAEAKAQADRLRGLLRDKQTLQMARFPDPIEHLGSTTAKVEISGRYAKVRFRLRDLADELEEYNPNIALAVLEQQIPVIEDKIERLASDQGVNGNYAFHLGQMEEQELNERQNKHTRALTKDCKELMAEKLRLGGVIAKLREDHKKAQEDVEYLRKHRSIYRTEQVEAWRKDAEGLKNRVEAVHQQKRLLMEELEQAKRRNKTISDESYARGHGNGNAEATRSMHQ